MNRFRLKNKKLDSFLLHIMRNGTEQDWKKFWEYVRKTKNIR